jgi:hypothetical protein
LSDVDDPTFSRQSAHRWRRGCQPYAQAVLHSAEIFSGIHFCQRLTIRQRTVRLKESGKWKTIDDLIGNRNRDLQACSRVPQPTTLSRGPLSSICYPQLIISSSLIVAAKRKTCLLEEQFHATLPSEGRIGIMRVVKLTCSATATDTSDAMWYLNKH